MGEPNYQAGVPCWAELATTDADGAKQFYGELLGWEFDDTPVGEGMTYSMANRQGKTVAALYKQHDEMRERDVPPMWLSYFTVDDVDASARAVEQAGGQLHAEPFDVMDLGRMALCQDPTGAMFALWQAKEYHGAQVVNEAGALCWNELATSDPGQAGEFYEQVFGWKRNEEPYGEGVYTVFKLPGYQSEEGGAVAGMLPPDALPEGVPPHWTVYFGVEDCDAAVEQAQSSDGELLFGPVALKGVGRFAALKDPQGATFSIIALSSGEEEAEAAEAPAEDKSEAGQSDDKAKSDEGESDEARSDKSDEGKADKSDDDKLDENK